MANFLIKQWRGGISDYAEPDKSKVGSGKFLKNLDIRKPVNSLSCQQALIAETISGTTLTALPIACIPTPDGNSYVFTKDGKIFKRDSTTKVSTLVYTESSESGNIVGACMWWESTQGFLYWATPTRLNRKPFPGLANWSDVNTTGTGTWPKTTLTSATWHLMKEILGQMFVCNSNTVALVGFDSSFTIIGLQLIPGNISNSLLERNRKMVVGCTRSDTSETGMIFDWDGSADSWTDKQILPAKGVNAIIDAEVPLAQVGTSGQVFYADFVNKEPLFSFPGGGQVDPHGVCYSDGMALFGVYGNGTGKTGIYSYGRNKLGDDRVLNLEYQIDCDEIGFVEKVGGDILIGIKISTSYYVMRVNTALKATGVFESLDITVPLSAKIDGDVPTWTKHRITCKPMPSGCSISLKRRVDKTGDFVACNLEGGETSYSTVDGTEAEFLIGDIGTYYEYQVTLTPSANTTPEIYSQEIFFE